GTGRGGSDVRPLGRRRPRRGPGAALRPPPARRPALRGDQPGSGEVGPGPARTHRVRARAPAACRPVQGRGGAHPGAPRRGSGPGGGRPRVAGPSPLTTSHPMPEDDSMTTTASTAPAVAPPNLPVMLHHYIDGEHVPSEGGRTFTTADPVTNRPYAAVAAGG